ncbi:glutaredoxin [Mycobacteroides abscessus subsp. bolletii]|nr:glutaredoxin [Mycobacteroides abscessus subsp. bolletii]
MEVTIYSPDVPCVACSTTKRQLDKNGIEYVSVVASAEQVERFKADGYSAFPVVVVDCGDGATWSWSGFRFDDVKRLIELSDAKAAKAA